jgi:hypothetical protein
MSTRPATRSSRPSWLGLALLALVACGEDARALQRRISERLQQGLTSTDKKRPEEPDRLPPELVLNKLRLYVECLSATRVPLYDAYRQAAAAFAGRTRQPPAEVPRKALDQCDKAERDGPLLKPPMPALEQAGAAYRDGARLFAATIDAVREDMSRKPSSVIDAGKDSPIYNNFSDAHRAWDETRRALAEQIEVRQARLDAAVLAEIEARAGAGLEWHTRNVIVQARPYVRCIGDHDEFTAGVCDAYHAAFGAAYAEFRAAYESDPDTAAGVFWLPQFADSLAEYAAAADALAAAVRARKARSGDIGRVVLEYDDALRDAGTVNFTRRR